MEYQLVHHRCDNETILALPACDMMRFKRIVKRGGAPAFVLASDSTFLKPIWLLLVRDEAGTLMRVTTPTNSRVRRLDSVRKVYQIARACGFPTLHIPVELRQ